MPKSIHYDNVSEMVLTKCDIKSFYGKFYSPETHSSLITKIVKVEMKFQSKKSGQNPCRIQWGSWPFLFDGAHDDTVKSSISSDLVLNENDIFPEYQNSSSKSQQEIKQKYYSIKYISPMVHVCVCVCSNSMAAIELTLNSLWNKW